MYVPDFGWFPPDSGISGWNWVGGAAQHISPGIGASGSYPWWERFRLFNPPVITRILLTARAT